MKAATHPTFFEFEADFVASLRCIPIQVRFNLDTCGVKLKLTHWLQFSPTERQMLFEAACASPQEISNYRERVQSLVIRNTGAPASLLPIATFPAWMDAATIPAEVQEKGRSLGMAIDLVQWSRLTPLQRFVLIKLSRSSHENKNFLPALREFQIG